MKTIFAAMALTLFSMTTLAADKPAAKAEEKKAEKKTESKK